MGTNYKDFNEFWPFYVREHSKKGTRTLHFIGTTALFIFLTASIWNGSVWSLIGGIFSAYACAWTGHFLIEKNRPATFHYPLLSLMGDFKMYAFMLTGRMEKELQRINPGPV